jgi:hypothetical protein
MSTSEDPVVIERLCRISHDAYEAAAKGAGWETQEASRKAWEQVPEPNKVTMRASIKAVLEELDEWGLLR